MLRRKWQTGQTLISVVWLNMFLHDLFICQTYFCRFNPNMYPVGVTVLCDKQNQQAAHIQADKGHIIFIPVLSPHPFGWELRCLTQTCLNLICFVHQRTYDPYDLHHRRHQTFHLQRVLLSRTANVWIKDWILWRSSGFQLMRSWTRSTKYQWRSWTVILCPCFTVWCCFIAVRMRDLFNSLIKSPAPPAAEQPDASTPFFTLGMVFLRLPLFLRL